MKTLAMALRRGLFQEDILQCLLRAQAQGDLVHPCGRLARQILEKLGVNATGPPVAKARARPRQEHFDLHPDDPGVDPQYPTGPTPRRSVGKPSLARSRLEWAC